MRLRLTVYVAALVALLLADGLWLSTMLPFYQQRLGAVLAPVPDPLPACLFYLLYALGVVALAVRPGTSPGPWPGAARRGALLGLVAYGTYDLTNQATLSHWPVLLTLVDMGWGGVLTAWAATVGAMAAHWIGRSRVKFV